MLRKLLEARRVTLSRFAPVSYILCCEEGPTCMHQSGHLDKPLNNVLWPYCSKYTSELGTVINTMTSFSQGYSLPRNRWASFPEWVWLPPAMSDGEILSERGDDLTGYDIWKLGCCLGPSGYMS